MPCLEKLHGYHPTTVEDEIFHSLEALYKAMLSRTRSSDDDIDVESRTVLYEMKSPNVVLNNMDVSCDHLITWRWF